MSTRKIFSLICMCLTILLIVCIFLPFFDLGSYGGTYSLWEYFFEANTGGTAVLLLIELIIALVAFTLQLAGATDDAKLAYLGLGYYFTYNISTFMSALSNSAFDQLSFGFWLGFILSIITVVLAFIGSFLSNKKKAVYTYSAPTPVSYDPYTGEPIYK